MRYSTSSRALASGGLGLVLALVGACSTDPGTGPGHDAGGSGTDTGSTPGDDTGTPGDDTGTPPPVDAYVPHDSGPFTDACQTLTFPPVLVPDGTEDTQCVVVDLGNDLPMHVGSIHNVLGPASHHFIVYRASSTATAQPDPTPCTPFVDTLSSDSGSPLMITQRSDETLTLPPGVAYTLPPHQLMRLEIHYINLTGADAMVSPTTTLCPIPDADYTADADFLFIGNPDITIDPHTSATLGPTFYRLDSRFSSANFFAITGHTHQFGTNVLVQTGPSSSGPFADVYNIPGWSWSEPETAHFATPFQIPSGGGFNFTCEWNNTSADRVTFGESANNEMCFFWAYYYPAFTNAPHVCVHTDQIPGGFDLCCPGNPLCNTISSRLGG